MKHFSTWATKYRPKTFAEVEGQPDKAFLHYLHKKGMKLPPVILLAGPSGVGKTTIARIAAAASNCFGSTDHDVGDGEPCGRCPNCIAIFDDQFPGVSEIDAATNSGADHMRQLREQAYMQVPGLVQVFIIDEAHGLSNQAWNVLLKLFEEPPEGVVFFLLTSEPSKVPVKIRTRAMRLDFGKVAPTSIRARLTSILKENGREPDEMLDTFIDLSDGSLREAIMLMEQSFIGEDEFCESLRKRDQAFEVIHAALSGNHAAGLTLLHESYERTGDIQGIMERWGLAMEKILLHKYSFPVFVSPAREQLLKELAAGMDDMQWAAGMEVLSDWATKAVSRAHLSFVWSSFVKALNGPTPIRKHQPEPTVAVRNEKVGQGEVGAFLSELNFG